MDCESQSRLRIEKDAGVYKYEVESIEYIHIGMLVSVSGYGIRGKMQVNLQRNVKPIMLCMICGLLVAYA